MKATITNIKHLCALLLTALAFAACSGDTDDIVNQPEPQQPAADGIRFTAVFGVKNAGTTRALTDPDNGTLTASWQVGEQIAIVFGGNKYTAEVTAVDANGSATVSATLPNGTPNNQAVTFIYPASAADGSGVRSDLLATQDGTLATLSSQFDVATATGSLIVSGTEAMPNGSVSLQNQYAVCKLQFKDENNQDITDITEVTITDLATQKVITVTTPSPQSAVYVAMAPTSNSVKFKVEGYGGNIYTKTATSNLQAGKFYHPTLSTSCFFNAMSTPLTFEAIQDCTIYFINEATGPVSYSGDKNGTINSDCGDYISLSAGQKVSFYGDNEDYVYYDESDHYPFYSGFTLSADCYVYGNIMSLISSTNYPELKELTGGFPQLFQLCEHLKNHPNKQLVLPATTLSGGCYEDMFSGCTGLTKAPALPATTLKPRCYSGMFYRCFGLTKAPDLPATTLVNGCYDMMFSDCTNLNSIKCLATDISATECTSWWLNGVASNGTFTKAAGVNWSSGKSGIPSGWTVEDAQ